MAMVGRSQLRRASHSSGTGAPLLGGRYIENGQIFHRSTKRVTPIVSNERVAGELWMGMSPVDDNCCTAVFAVGIELMLAFLSMCYIRRKGKGNTRRQENFGKEYV